MLGLAQFSEMQSEILRLFLYGRVLGNRQDGSSQGGQITIMVSSDLLEGRTCDFSVLSWSARKLLRVARSSSNSEVQQFGNTWDAHEFIKLLFLGLDTLKYELLNVDPLFKNT